MDHPVPDRQRDQPEVPVAPTAPPPASEGTQKRAPILRWRRTMPTDLEACLMTTATTPGRDRYRPQPSVLTALKSPRILTREVLAFHLGLKIAKCGLLRNWQVAFEHKQPMCCIFILGLNIL